MFKFKKSLICGFVMLLILVCISGCYSTSIEKSNTTELPKEDSTSYRILYIHLKDSTVIDVINLEARYVKKFDSVKNVIRYQENKYRYGYIKLDDVREVVVEKTTFNAGQTVVAIVAILGAVLAALVLLLSGFRAH